jgi:hypothetical protein
MAASKASRPTIRGDAFARGLHVIFLKYLIISFLSNHPRNFAIKKALVILSTSAFGLVML